MENYEVIIVGGGPAGLAAATALGRSRRSVLVLDAAEPRNALSPGAHNVLGHEGIAPQELLRRGRAEASGYGVRFVTAPVDGVSGSVADGFNTSTGTQTYRAERILLATGLRDNLPAIPGIWDAWGKSVLHCPYCHGWEVRDQRIAVLGVGPMSLHQAQLFSQLSEHTIYINHEPSFLDADGRRVLHALNVPVVDARIESLDVDPAGQLHALRLTNGQSLEMDAAVVMSRMEANAHLYELLGGSLTEHPLGHHIAVDQMGATAIPGVYAAGNITELGAMVLGSAAAGVMAGAAINIDLLTHKVQVLLGESSI